MTFKIVIKQFISLFLFILFLNTAYSTVYYVSSSGNDGNNGLSQASPWKTITKVNSMMGTFNPGDQILFKRGEKFFGTLSVTKTGTSGNEIVFGSYGTGNLPEMTGKKLITGWTVYSGNIYKATLTDTISNLYCNGKIMIIARFPNTGFLKIDAGNGTTGFYDAALTQSAGYWIDANCRFRLINWSYATRPVSGFSGGNVTFSSASPSATNADYGYYFDNKLSLLDVESEWYQDKATGTVYLFAPGGVNPNSLTVEGIVNKKNISLYYNVNYIKIQDLNITGCKDMGIEILDGNTVTIQRCNINQTGRFGINLSGVNPVIDNNIFTDNLNSAINASLSGGTIKNNTIRRTGLIPGYGEDGWGYIAMNLSGSVGISIQNNIIDSTGYSAITSGSDFIIKNNVISYSLLTLNDGGGIYVTTANGLQILNNIISNIRGNTESNASPAYYANGIYINNAVMNNTTIQGNTIYGCRNVGMNVDIVNSSVNNKIINNLLYNNFISQILFTDYSSTSYIPNYNITVKNNIFYSLSTVQNCMEQMNFSQSFFSDWGNFDSNYYCNPYTEFVVRKTKNHPTYSTDPYNLSTWKSTFNEDPHSKTSLVSFSQYGITDTLSSNLIANSRFISNINTWATWPSGSNIAYATNPALDTGCMRLRWDGTGYGRSFTTCQHFSVVKDAYYLASISCVGVNSGSFSLWVFPTNLPFNYFSYGTTRNDYSYTFKADTTLTSESFSISMVLPDTLLYVDNVNLFKVNVDRIDSTQKSKLFVNENNFVQAISLGGVTYQDLNGNPVSGSIMLQPYSSAVLINENFIAVRNLQLKLFIEGLYNAASDNMISDTIRVYVRNSTTPYIIVDSAAGICDPNGNSSLNFIHAANSTPYYLSIRHRNSLETWTKNPVSFTSNQMTYDFTTSASTAYGDNLVLKNTRYCLYSGDVFRNGQIDLVDLTNVYNAAALFSTGYVPEDVTGNQVVDLNDINIVYNNSTNFVKLIRP